MSINPKSILKKLHNEINGSNKPDSISSYEEIVAENISEFSKIDSFFTLPLQNIFSILSKIDFSEIESNIKIIQNITKSTIAYHMHEKEVLFLLEIIKIEDCSFNMENCIQIIELFSNSDICVKIGQLYHENIKLLDGRDMKYELEQKENEIERLQNQLKIYQDLNSPLLNRLKFPAINQKPKDYEPDIHKACSLGKFKSVQYMIEWENVDANLKDINGKTPLHYACEKCHIPIVEYLIEIAKVDIKVVDKTNITPLLYALRTGNIKLINYLIQKLDLPKLPSNFQPNIFIACASNDLSSVKYIIENIGEIQNIKDQEGKTPLHYAAKNGSLQLVKYLVEECNANVNIPDKLYKTPLEYAISQKNDEIKTYLESKGAIISLHPKKQIELKRPKRIISSDSD